jgi:hypothetical protein
MKMTLKANRLMFGLVAAACALGMALTPRASAEVSDADFNALKEAVQKLSGQMQSLQQTNLAAEQAHAQDQQEIQQLKEKLAETQQMATNAEQKSIEVAEAQQLPPRQPIDEATVNHNFMMMGDAEIQFNKTSGQNAAFEMADFAPVFLYRAGDNILFEAGFDTTIQNADGGGYNTTFNLTFAQMDYVVNDYVTFAGGELLLPLGTYSLRSAGWLNKIPDDPLAVDALLPGSGVGAELLGAVPLGEDGKFINYAVFGVNGPGSADGTGTAGALDLGGNVGTTSSGVNANLHTDPSGGGRVGLFVPFPYKPHYDVEVGVSGQSGQWDNAGNYLWTAGVLDAALHLGPNFETKGEFIETQYGSSDMGLVRQQGWYVQSGYKLAGLNLEIPFVNNLEIVGRYDTLLNAYDSGSGSFYNTRRTSVGYIYYFTSTLLFEGDYEFYESNDPGQFSNQLMFQLSLGF